MTSTEITLAAQKIVATLKGKWFGQNGMVRCPAHEDAHPSCRVRVGESGILVNCYAGCDRYDIIAALVRLKLWPEAEAADVTVSATLRRETSKAFLIFDGTKETWLPKRMVKREGAGSFTMPDWLAKEKNLSRGPTAPRRYAPLTPPPIAPRAMTEEDRERVAFALRIWNETRSAFGTPVDRYWHDARGLTLPVPDVIHFGEAVPYGYRPNAKRYPAMVAMVQAPDGTFAGVHCTYLMPDGSGKRQDAPESRLAFGCLGGCAIRLAPAVDELAVGEGIESTASFMGDFGVAGWAALNTSGLRNIILPPPPLAFAVTLLGENDSPKGPRNIVASDEAIAAATARLRLEGRLVGSVYPAEEFGDFNDPHRRVAA